MVHTAHWLISAWGTFNVHGYTIDQRLNLPTRFIPEHETFRSHQLGSIRHLWHHPSKLPWTRQQQNLLSRRDNILSCIMHFWSGQLFTTRAHNKRIAVCVTGEIKTSTHPCDVRTRNTVKYRPANIARDTRAVVHNSSHSAIHPHSHPLPAHVSAHTPLLSVDTTRDQLPTEVNDILCARETAESLQRSCLRRLAKNGTVLDAAGEWWMTGWLASIHLSVGLS